MHVSFPGPERGDRRVGRGSGGTRGRETEQGVRQQGRTQDLRIYTRGHVRAHAKCFGRMLMKKNMAKGISENLEHCINMFISPYVQECPCCVCLAKIRCSKTSCALLCINSKNWWILKQEESRSDLCLKISPNQLFYIWYREYIYGIKLINHRYSLIEALLTPKINARNNTFFFFFGQKCKLVAMVTMVTVMVMMMLMLIATTYWMLTMPKHLWSKCYYRLYFNTVRVKNWG